MVYTELKTFLQSWLHDTSAEFVALADTFIQLGEARMNRDLRSPKLIVNATGTIAATVSLPTDFQELVSLTRVDSATTWTPLNAITVTALRNGNTGFYLSNAGINFSPSLSGTYSLSYYKELPSIITNSTNDILANHPDLYLYACMLEAAAFLRDEKEQDFFNKYSALLDSVNTTESKAGQSYSMRADINVP